MSINDENSPDFYVSHIWPGMIDISCCNCEKNIGSLQNREVEAVDAKTYILKKRFKCKECGASQDAGTKISTDKPSISMEERARRKEQVKERTREAMEEAARLSAKLFGMITTTGSNVEGYRISEYKGLVCGASIYNVGGLIGGGYLDKVQSNLFAMAIRSAKETLVHDAFYKGADAVIAIQTSLGGSATMNQLVVTLTGTAVKLEKI